MRVQLVVSAAALILASVVAIPAHAAAAEVVAYECTTKATGEKQQVSLNVDLTVPAQAAVDVQMTIGWNGTYVTGSELVAPAAGMEGEINLYAYAGISKIENLTSATGVSPIGTIVPGEPIPLPQTSVELKTTPKKPGSGTVHAASFNLGPRPQERLIECEVKDKGDLTEYPLTVTGAGDSTAPSPDPDDTDTETTDPGTDTKDETDVTDPEPEDTVTETPAGGADTGAGGEAGPDGRMVMGTGVVIMLAAVAGLRLRRPRKVRSPRAGGRSTGP
ncbi:hypothetical protein SAMN05444920_10875 [Nonomuraea solani]|uniref:Uncharacterized protein n=1 Tax=Nonomuraea solani TaxID=1144553 RepID=A0A1H6E8L3_9ACTN|nr:hypothetical protein [Nonomuraea solani]SEG93254.1 hypothetical protein SAMN05444920_10875 [Nonomuraea solani]